MPTPTSQTWIDPNSCRSLAVLVETVTSPLLVRHAAAVCLEVDIDAGLRIPADPGQTAKLIETLVSQALREMPDGGDLIVTACETQRGVELEFADSGGDVEDRSQSLPLTAASIGAKLHWQNCPQGGGAVTITFPRLAQARRKAA